MKAVRLPARPEGVYNGGVANSDDSDRVPYIAYSTFKSYVGKLRVAGQLPTQIDRSVLSTMPGGTQGVFLANLRALRLIDESGAPLPDLEGLTKESSYAPTLKRLIEVVYSKEILAQLARGTPKTLADAMPLKSKGTQNKAASFLVKAALDLELDVSPHLLDEKGKPKGLGMRTKARSPKKNTTTESSPAVPTEPGVPPRPTTPSGLSVQKIPLAPGREAQLYWPENITAEEIERLFAALDVFKQFLKLLLPPAGSAVEDHDAEEDDNED